MLTFERYCHAWAMAVNDRDTDELMSLLSDDFKWVTYTQDPAGLDTAGTRKFCLSGGVSNVNYTSTIYDSEEIIAGMNEITRNGEASNVLGVAKVRDGKVYEYHHIRAPK